MLESGTVQAVYDETLGSVLSADSLAGDVTLYVASVAYFAPNGGTMTIDDGTNSETLTYTGVDETTLSLTGVSPLANGYSALDTTVNVYPEATNRVAEVRLDGQQDTIRARVPYAIFDKIAPGFVAEANDEVLRVQVELQDEYVVRDVLGTVPAALVETLEVVDNLLVTGNMELAGSAVIDSGVTMTLTGQQVPPDTAPTAAQDWYTDSSFDPVDTTVSALAPFVGGNRYGYFQSGTEVYYCGTTSAGLVAVRSFDTNTLVGTTRLSSVSGYYSTKDGGVCKIGTNWYLMAYKSSASAMYVRKYDASWNYVSEFAWPVSSAGYNWAFSTDGTYLYGAEVITSGANAGKVRVRKVDTTGALISTITATTALVSGGGNVFALVPNITADLAGARYVMLMDNDQTSCYVMDGSGVWQGSEGWPSALISTDAALGLVHDGTNFWTFKTGSTISGVSSSTRYRMELNYWTSGSAKVWVSYTWGAATGGSAPSYQTTRSPRKSYTMSKRKRQTITVVAPPSGDAARVYLGRGSTEPASTAQYYQTVGAADATQIQLTAALATSVAAPTTNSYPGSNAAKISSGTQGAADSTGDGTGWTLEGTGGTSGFTDCQVFSTPGTYTWTKPDSGGMSVADVYIISGGGGGGGGRRSAAAGNAGGGGGGGGSGVLIASIPLSLLSATETVIVGSGGTGGAARSSTNDGNPGNDGGQSSMTVAGVAAALYAVAGKGGNGGTNSTGGGGGVSGHGSVGADQGTGGATGGIGAVGGDAQGVPYIVTNWYRKGAPGGGGGGATAGGTTNYAGGAGGGAWDLAGGAGNSGATAGGNGSTKLAGAAFVGSAGGGSGGRFSADCAAGGNGGKYGAGGGGGGGAAGFNSGAGGNGGDGIVIVICR